MNLFLATILRLVFKTRTQALSLRFYGFYFSDEMSNMESHRKPLKRGLMQTDSTEVGDKPYSSDSEFTQAWDTVGAGALSQTRVRESLTKMSEKLL